MWFWDTAPQIGRWHVWFPVVIGIYHCHNPFGCIVAMGSTRAPNDTSTRSISWGVNAAVVWGWQPYHHHVPTVLKSGIISLLETSGSVQACTGIAGCHFLWLAETLRIWKQFVRIFHIEVLMKIKELHSGCFLSDRFQCYDNCCTSYPVTCTTSKKSHESRPGEHGGCTHLKIILSQENTINKA